MIVTMNKITMKHFRFYLYPFIILYIALLASSCKNKSDNSQVSLYKKLKVSCKKYYRVNYSAGEENKAKLLFLAEYFDHNGNVFKIYHYPNLITEDTLKYTYKEIVRRDNQGNLYERTYYEKDGDVLYKRIYSLDNKNRQTGFVDYNKEGDSLDYAQFFYGNKINQEVYIGTFNFSRDDNNIWTYRSSFSAVPVLTEHVRSNSNYYYGDEMSTKNEDYEVSSMYGDYYGNGDFKVEGKLKSYREWPVEYYYFKNDFIYKYDQNNRLIGVFSDILLQDSAHRLMYGWLPPKRDDIKLTCHYRKYFRYPDGKLAKFIYYSDTITTKDDTLKTVLQIGQYSKLGRLTNIIYSPNSIKSDTGYQRYIYNSDGFLTEYSWLDINQNKGRETFIYMDNGLLSKAIHYNQIDEPIKTTYYEYKYY